MLVGVCSFAAHASFDVGHARLATRQQMLLVKRKAAYRLAQTCNGQQSRFHMLFSTLCIYKVCGWGLCVLPTLTYVNSPQYGKASSTPVAA